MAFNSDGTKLISAGQHATLKLWDLTGKPVTCARSGSKPSVDREAASNAAAATVRWVGGVAFRPDGASLRPRAPNETVALWVVGSGRLERIIQAPGEPLLH